MRELVLILALAATSCVDSAAEAAGRSDELSGKLVLTGSSTVAPLAAEMAKRFESLHPGVRIDVQTGGSSRGLADARSGAADIGMASRRLQDGERDLHAFTIARDGVSLIVHRDNPVQSLTDAQVTGIYTGEIADWGDVGGASGPIRVVSKAAGRATLEVFLAHFELENRQVRADVVVGENEHGVKTVAGNRSAIGYVSIGTAEVNMAADVPIKLLPLGGVAATTARVSDGSFPISRPLNFVTARSPTGLAKTFIDFAQSDRVHDLVLSQSFVPIAR